MKDSMREYELMDHLERMVDRHKEFWQRCVHNNEDPLDVMYQRGLFEGFNNAYQIAYDYLFKEDEDGDTPENIRDSEGD